MRARPSPARISAGSRTHPQTGSRHGEVPPPYHHLPSPAIPTFHQKCRPGALAPPPSLVGALPANAGTRDGWLVRPSEDSNLHIMVNKVLGLELTIFLKDEKDLKLSCNSCFCIIRVKCFDLLKLSNLFEKRKLAVVPFLRNAFLIYVTEMEKQNGYV